MNTEMTDKSSNRASTATVDPRVAGNRGLILYDDECAVCRALRDKVEQRLTAKGFVFLPLRIWRDDYPDTSPDEMALALPHGRMLSGADAFLFLCRRIWWLWPFAMVAGLPGIRALTWMGYRWFAARRYRFGCHCEGEAGACNLTKKQH